MQIQMIGGKVIFKINAKLLGLWFNKKSISMAIVIIQLYVVNKKVL